MEDVREEERRRRNPSSIREGSSLRDEIAALKEEIRYGERKKETSRKGTPWNFPFKWKFRLNKSLGRAAKQKVLVFYLNIKGEIEPPLLVPIYSGNMVIIRNKPYEIDPRAFWKLGKYKVMIVKEIDRRPVSNLDYSEIKKRGDATDSDEFLIKAAMKAVQATKTQQVNKAIIIIVIIAIAAAAIFLFTRGGA